MCFCSPPRKNCHGFPLAGSGARSAPLPARRTPWQFLRGGENCCHGDRLGTQASVQLANTTITKARVYSKIASRVRAWRPQWRMPIVKCRCARCACVTQFDFDFCVQSIRFYIVLKELLLLILLLLLLLLLLLFSFLANNVTETLIKRVDRRPQALFPANNGLKTARMRKMR